MRRRTRSSKILKMVSNSLLKTQHNEPSTNYESDHKDNVQPSTSNQLDYHDIRYDDVFDSDDSVTDKTYQPPSEEKQIDSDSSSDFIENSQPAKSTNIIIPESPDNSLSLHVVNVVEPQAKKPKKQIDGSNKVINSVDANKPKETEEYYRSVSNVDDCEPVTTEGKDYSINNVEECEPEINEVQGGSKDVANNNEECETIEVTKKGGVRKRRYFDTSKEERQNKKKADKILKNYLVKEGCTVICKKKCSENFSQHQREKINKFYWSMTWAQQKLFINNSTSTVKPSRIKNFSGTDKKNRTKSIQYFFKNESGEQLSVCRLFFLTTLGYKKTNEKVIRNAINNKDTVPFDKRGHNDKASKIDREIIKKHIEAYKPTISHYRREHAPNKRYLPAELTIQTMHDEFMKEHGHNTQVSYDYYRKTVKSLNISFAKLGHEECEICEAYHIHNPRLHEIRHRKCEVCTKFEVHQGRSRLARMHYDRDRNAEKSLDAGYFSADLQKVIMLPRIDTFKTVLFCPRLVAFNESFVPLGQKTSEHMTFAAIWHEAVSGRKKEDIACTFKAFIKHYRDLKNITVWLDNCAAQNKNWALFSFLLMTINSDEVTCEKVVLKYFETGHTFMSADEFHHQVELGMKKVKKVYDFDDFADIVASTNKHKTIAKRMEVGDFFKIIDDTSTIKIQKSNPRVYLRDISEVCFQRGKKSILYKCSFEDTDYHELDCLKKRVINKGFSAIIQNTRPRGITSERKNAIIEKLGPLMPLSRKNFWENISVNNAAVDLSNSYED